MKRLYKQWFPLLIGTAGVALLATLAVFLINRESATSVAIDAENSIIADNTLSAVTAVRSATMYALTLTEVAENAEPVGVVLDGLEEAATDLEGRVARLAAELDDAKADEIIGHTDEFLDATKNVVRALSLGRVDTASTAVDEQAAALGPLAASLIAARDESIQRVLVAGEGVGRAAEAARFLILFFIPAGVMFAFWRTQRQRNERRLLSDEVEKHRQIAMSKDAFVADVSHELRTPLTGIYGFAVSLEEGSKGMSARQKEMVRLIVDESAELSRMVDDLIAIGRIDAGAVTYSFEHVDVAEEIEGVMKTFNRREISFEYASPGISVYADAARLRQVLRNLMSNAVRYGGEHVGVRVLNGDDSTTIEVIDDGPGVPSNVEERLFQRYVHTGGSAILEGSVGLGLAIARSFAHGMGGNLTYQRIDGRSVFQFSLPTSSRADTPSSEGDAEDVEYADSMS